VADTLIEFFAPSGLSLVVDLFLQSEPDVRVATTGPFEAGNARGFYFAVIPEAVVGRCNAVVRLGVVPIGAFAIDLLDDTEIHRALPLSQIDAIRTKTDRIGAGTLSVAGAGLSAAGDLTLIRGDSAAIEIAVDANLEDADELWLTAKRRVDQEDATSLIMLSLLGGLMVLDGEANVDADQTGSLAITDAAAGEVVLSLSAAATAALPIVFKAVYDIQKRTAAGSVQTVGTGAFKVVGDVTRTTGGAP
jgi:hypothetical protein